MTNILVVIHVMLAISLICVVLLQRSEGGGLGIGGGGGGGGGMGGFLTGRGTKSLLTQATAILAACFMLTSLGLTWIESHRATEGSLIDELPVSAPVETVPESPTAPSVPVE